jgi:tetratricopeptide (TPR) repeat protein
MSATATLAAAVEAHRAGRLDEAAAAYRSLLAANPDHADALNLLGVVLVQQNTPAQALPLLQKATTLKPNVADYWNRLGLAHAALGDAPAAEKAYRAALDCQPDHAEALNNLGILIAAEGDHAAAVVFYRAAVKADLGLALARNNLGVSLTALGELEAAEAAFRGALRANTAYFEARTNLADLLQRRGRMNDAVAEARRAVAGAPAHMAARLVLVNALAGIGDLDGAREAALAAVAQAPGSAVAHNSLGLVLRQAGDINAAIAAFDAALARDPDLVDAHANRALALVARGDIAEARKGASEALRKSGAAPVHRMNLAMLDLLGGDLKTGFAAYGSRFASGLPWVRARPFGQPAWQGDRLDGGLLVWGEQGIGEEIMFASQLSWAAARAGACVVEVEHRLVPLFARSFPQARVVARTEPPDPACAAAAAQAALGDLPGLCLDAEGELAPRRAYMQADAAKVAAARQRMAGLGEGARIGIAWRSSGANVALGAEKSAILEAWSPLLTQPGVQFVNLQYGEVGGELAGLDVPVWHDEAVDQMADLDGFAAQIAGLDLLVTISTAAAHLAGALGVESWVLLPHVPDWRWQMGRDDTLWYPRSRVFRQPAPGDWEGLIAVVAERMSTYLAERRRG